MSRFYDPEIGSISSDDVGYVDIKGVDGLNLYCYCGNDTINKYDPTGYFMISTAVLIGTLIGAAVLRTAGGIIAYNVAN